LPSDTETLTFRLGDEEWTLTHTFDDLRANGLIRYRFDDTRPTDYLTGWITHLFLNASQPSSTSGQTVWHSRNGAYLLNPVTDAYAQLQTLLTLYRQGLREPLHFYPKSSWAYVSNNMDLNKATTKWHGGRNEEYGEGRDPAYMQALRGKPDPLDAAFENCSRAVFEPLLNCISDPRLEQAS
jgi:exodeoxyribonuclease V gamma subunit